MHGSVGFEVNHPIDRDYLLRYYSNQIIKEVKLHFNEMVFKTIIHRNVKLGEAPSYGENILDYDVSSTGANNYLNLARELILNNS